MKIEKNPTKGGAKRTQSLRTLNVVRNGKNTAYTKFMKETESEIQQYNSQNWYE